MIGKFRPEIAITTCTNQLRLPKNGRLGLGLVSNMALKKRNHESPLGTFRPEKQDYLFTVLVCFQMFRYSLKFSAGTTQNGVFHLVSNRISGNFL